MNLKDFENGLKILHSLDSHELGDPPWWDEFRNDPVNLLLHADDAMAAIIWAAMVKRGAVKAIQIKPTSEINTSLKESTALIFDKGALTVRTKGYGHEDGSGYFSFPETVIDWENDEGRNYGSFPICQDDLVYLRDHLNGLFP